MAKESTNLEIPVPSPTYKATATAGPGDNTGNGSLPMTDPVTGNPVPVADLRAEFERLSFQVPRDPEAERAFIEIKIEMIHTDSNLTEVEKQRAIDELRVGR
jgi:hypothetical protein